TKGAGVGQVDRAMRRNNRSGPACHRAAAVVIDYIDGDVFPIVRVRHGDEAAHYPSGILEAGLAGDHGVMDGGSSAGLFYVRGISRLMDVPVEGARVISLRSLADRKIAAAANPYIAVR